MRRQEPDAELVRIWKTTTKRRRAALPPTKQQHEQEKHIAKAFKEKKQSWK
ncbi:22970_t:CDS:2, partial [Dentiscutata erythropus]